MTCQILMGIYLNVISSQMKIGWILFRVTLPLASTSCVPCVWRYKGFHLVCQTKLHLSLVWLYLLSTDDIPREPLILSWIGHQTSKVLLTIFIFWNEHSNASIDFCSKREWSLPILSSRVFLLYSILFSVCLRCLRKPYCFVSFWSWLTLSGLIFG